MVIIVYEVISVKPHGKKNTDSLLPKIAVIGFCGGLIWSFVGYIFYLFHFTEIGTNFLLLLFPFGDWKEKILGQFVGILVLAMLSIVIAFAYLIFFRKFLGVFPGIILGMVLWVMAYVLLPLLSTKLMEITEVHRATITTSICLCILYGVFIAYSVSYANYSNK